MTVLADRHREEVKQHIAWLRLFVSTMTAANWRDMQANCERQLDRLAGELGVDAETVEK
jgi:hypothetical protein